MLGLRRAPNNVNIKKLKSEIEECKMVNRHVTHRRDSWAVTPLFQHKLGIVRSPQPPRAEGVALKDCFCSVVGGRVNKNNASEGTKPPTHHLAKCNSHNIKWRRCSMLNLCNKGGNKNSQITSEQHKSNSTKRTPHLKIINEKVNNACQVAQRTH